MKKLITLGILSVIMINCSTDKARVDDLEVVEVAEEFTNSDRGRHEKELRQWFIGGYVTDDIYRSKTLSNASYSDSNVTESRDIRMTVTVDEDGFSFRVFPGRGNTNKSHAGGYKITVRNELGDVVTHTSRRHGKAVIMRGKDERAYEEFDTFFKKSEISNVTIRDNYLSVYRGTLDTKYY